MYRFCFCKQSIFLLCVGVYLLSWNAFAQVKTYLPIEKRPGHNSQKPAGDILILGDSHTVDNEEYEIVGGQRIIKRAATWHTFGYYLRKALEAKYTVDKYSLAGSNPSNWTRSSTTFNSYSEHLQHASTFSLKKKSAPAGINEIFQPQRKAMILEFGDNMANYRGVFPREGIISEVNKILEKAVTSPGYDPKTCFWVTPTYGEYNKGSYRKSDARLNELINVVKQTVGNHCQVIDSRKLPGFAPGMVRTGDGLHLGGEWAKKWGEGVAAVVLAQMNEYGLPRQPQAYGFSKATTKKEFAEAKRALGEGLAQGPVAETVKKPIQRKPNKNINLKKDLAQPTYEKLFLPKDPCEQILPRGYSQDPFFLFFREFQGAVKAIKEKIPYLGLGHQPKPPVHSPSPQKVNSPTYPFKMDAP